jgi:uncharacterized membrane protein
MDAIIICSRNIGCVDVPGVSGGFEATIIGEYSELGCLPSIVRLR